MAGKGTSFCTNPIQSLALFSMVEAWMQQRDEKRARAWTDRAPFSLFPAARGQTPAPCLWASEGRQGGWVGRREGKAAAPRLWKRLGFTCIIFLCSSLPTATVRVTCTSCPAKSLVVVTVTSLCPAPVIALGRLAGRSALAVAPCAAMAELVELAEAVGVVALMTGAADAAKAAVMMPPTAARGRSGGSSASKSANNASTFASHEAADGV